MSSEQIAQTYRALSPADLRILLGTELGMASREYVPAFRIVRYANLLEEEVVKHLPSLVDKRLLAQGSARSLGYVGFRINFLGYDCLALNALVKRGEVEALGHALGLGKESDVYDAKGRGGNRIVLKFHRLGRTSFRQTRRARGYVADRSHTSWMYQARMAATREFSAMKGALRAEVAVPKPLGQNRHLVAMELFQGTILSKIVVLSSPRNMLHHILIHLRRLFCDARLVHGDLSEYNILVDDSGRFAFIDWPQSVQRTDPRAHGLLRRDVWNVVNFFVKRFGVDASVEDALRFVKAKKRHLKTI